MSGKEMICIPCFVSLKEQSSLRQRQLAEQTTRRSVEPSSIEPRSGAKEETPLEEKIQARAALLDLAVLLAVRPRGRQDAPVDLLQEGKLCYMMLTRQLLAVRSIKAVSPEIFHAGGKKDTSGTPREVPRICHKTETQIAGDNASDQNEMLYSQAGP